MPRPEQCRYTKTHEWVYREGDSALMGITDFAQQELGDIVFVNVGEPGRTINAGEELGGIDSVKAVAQVYSPVSGEIVEVNGALADHPEMLNKDPQGEAWLVRIRLTAPAELDGLMDFAAYQKFQQEEAH
ncbi:MAG: glycine cleavage system protein GcvH [Acidobacteria bacterium]|nr:glycine cleavage system protein GcvH [Acidobacteriota bacterium]